MHQSNIAAKIQRSVPTVRRIETALIEKGLLERATAANGRRDGQDGLGMSLNPLVNALPDLQRRIQHIKLREERLRAIKAKIHQLRCTVFEYLKLGLPGNIRARVAYAIERRWTKEVNSLREDTAKAQLRHLKALSLWIETKIRTTMSAEPSENERQITEEEKKLNRRLEQREAREKAGRYLRRRVLDLHQIATPKMREYIEVYYDRNPAQIVQDMGREIGIQPEVLNRMLSIMGPERAFQSLLVTDRKLNDPINPVRNPSAYLQKLCTLFQAGTLKLEKTLRALQTRTHLASGVM